ncbi:hypothetical protein CLAFUW4_11366 [Fulvia fulva]|uniref:Uncharacterized protein n=1 Tax=Passalora fulva TaxID=5499 RepID=A0A9Q8PD06_PASFU|nr:uncharacterized protein CLAFUR5_10407 [Fulvia fulva]KAK4620118.1 hypothetical protein CLAFUR4_11372 [Fulvia fulva]KAK4620999.1 hypothetical protein CLAFUR0_11378 [Fulvia fulva]UJO20162.1 hypothetical protein CLAFUR5_10407 [Fulvia fulva]WPV17354.1 hypothetical protein CLAFUW4_11366 [Fulvia fulva]WPV32354.1 hypothetical protein CLAFUW7_11362 [Fulvia fulva]
MATPAVSVTKEFKIFRYLDLPAELQLRIIYFTVTSPDIIDISDDDDMQTAIAQPAKMCCWRL